MTGVLDIFITAVLVIAIVMLISGNGETLMRMFQGKNGRDVYETYDRARFDRGCLVFCIVLLINELATLFLAARVPAISLISVVVTVMAFVGLVIYLRRYARR